MFGDIPNIQLTIGNVTAYVGDTIIVPINVSDVSGLDIISYEITLDYSENGLQYLGFDNHNTLSNDGLIIDNAQNNQIHISAIFIQALADSGILLNLKFETLQVDTTMLTPASVVMNTTELTNTSSGLVMVLPVLTPPQVTIPTITASKGSNIIVPITGVGVTPWNIISFQSTIEFNPAVVTIDSISTTSSVLSGWIMQSVIADSQIMVAGMSINPLIEDGVLFYLFLNINSSAVTYSDLSFNSFIFNTGIIPQLIDGRIDLFGVETFGIEGEEINHVITLNPTFIWDSYHTMNSSTVEYKLQLGTDNDWNIAELLDLPWATNSGSYSFGLSGLIRGGDYFSRLKLRCDTLETAWYELIFHINQPPSVPVMLSPDSNRVVAEPVMLTVNNSNDMENDTVTYSFQVGFDPSFLAPLDSNMAVIQTPDSTSWTPLGLNENQLYWWRVRAHDGYIPGAWSHAWNFIVNSYNDPPVVSEIPDTSILENQTISISLTDYVSDVDLPSNNIVWSYVGGDSLIIVLEGDTVHITNNPGWVGLDSIFFIATDDSLASDSDLVHITVIPIPKPTNLMATGGLAYSVPLVWNSPNYNPTVLPDTVELIYDDGTPSNAYTWGNGARMANRLTPPWPCQVLEIEFYHGNPGQFRPGVYTWLGNQPGDVLVEFDYSSTMSGWVSIDISSYNVQVAGDFIVSNGLLNNTVSLGYDPVNNGRAWDWNGSSWTPWSETYFIRAIVQELTSGRIALIDNSGYNETNLSASDMLIPSCKKSKIIANPLVNQSPLMMRRNQSTPDRDLRQYVPRDILDYYNVFRSEAPGGPYIQIATNIIDTTYTDTNVELATTYFYVTTATYSDPPQESGFSNEASATTAFPPILSTLPDTSINEDDSLVISIMSWFPYVEDGDTPDESLEWFLPSSEHIITYQLDSIFIFVPEPNWYGQEQIPVIVSDSQLADTALFDITVNSVADNPVVLHPIEDLFLNEDQIDSSISLNEVFFDGDGDPLSFGYFGNQFIHIRIDSGIVFLTPDSNWFGSELVIFTAEDGTGRNIPIRDPNKNHPNTMDGPNSPFRTVVNDSVLITVLPVNDEPTIFSLIEPENNSFVNITNENREDTLVFLWEPSFDIDGDSIMYFLEWTGSLDLLHGTNWQEVALWIPYAFIIDTLQANGFTSINGTWNVLADDGEFSIATDNGPFTLTIDISQVAIGNDATLPTVFALHQNYPNPFNPNTWIYYDLIEQTEVNITVYDLLGSQVRILVSGLKDAGHQSVNWDGTNDQGQRVGAGIYLYKIIAGNFVQTRKMILLK